MDYYTNFEPKTKLLPIAKRTEANVKSWLGIEDGELKPNGYLDTLINSEAAKTVIKNASFKAVYTGEGWETTKKNFSEIIKGDRFTLGAFERYHRNYSYDLYSQLDRATGKIYAQEIGLQFAIYEGGIIETSREFCKEHNGNVYHISEIEKFNPKTAKQPNYNPVTDLGGYGCRHHLNWIPQSLALLLRPEAEKFI